MKAATAMFKLLSVMTNIKLFHFRTQYHGRYVSCDKFIDKYGENVDRFFEIYQGKYGRIEIPIGAYNFPFIVADDETIND